MGSLRISVNVTSKIPIFTFWNVIHNYISASLPYAPCDYVMVVSDKMSEMILSNFAA